MTKEEIEQLAFKSYGDTLLKGSFMHGYTQCQEDMDDTSKVTRFEVIDTNGRVYQKWNCNVELSYQDDGRTLKVFIKPLNKQD
jgi:hypothetical protein